ncbi:MAG TPA: RiPP maturation radical SAM C-methyltransferase [Thermoanaerobaculia bacterium]
MPTTPRVALVNMPLASSTRPSIQLGLLQAILAGHDIAASSHYLNLQFAARLGWERYEKFVWRGYSLGEWIFSRAAFGDRAPESQPYLDAFTDELASVYEKAQCGPDFLLQLRERDAPAFIDQCVDMVAWAEYDVVGFTSTFQQNCAALALARRLKQRYPRLVTVFGGANFEDQMGLEQMRAAPWIDHAVIGEGDHVFPMLLQRLAAGESCSELPGVASRVGDAVVFGGQAPLVRDLDAMPDPDYTDFFVAATALEVPEVVKGDVWLPFETARGCWWGAKHHCTFCGVNGAGMAYRSKSPARVSATIEAMTRRYNSRWLEAVDNILDPRYINEVFAPLAERGERYEIFYEMKVNLTQAQLDTLAKAGVRHVQPGIESMSSRLLTLMRKGATAIQNVRFLKWAEAYGMAVNWNVLFGFPGERREDYEQQFAIIRLIPHLQPPLAIDRIWLERFSPNFDQAKEFGIQNVRPERAYTYTYPAGVDLQRIAYFFDYDAPDTLPREVHQPLLDHFDWWKSARKAKRAPFLGYMNSGGRVTILDARQPAAPVVHVFEGRAAAIYEYCSPTYHPAPRILEHLRDDCGLDVDIAAVLADLATFVSAGLVLHEDGNYLSLAVPVKPDKLQLFAAITSMPIGVHARQAQTTPSLVLG